MGQWRGPAHPRLMRNMPADLACCRAFRVTKAMAPRLATVSKTCGMFAQRRSHSVQAAPSVTPLLECWMQQCLTREGGPSHPYSACVWIE